MTTTLILTVLALGACVAEPRQTFVGSTQDGAPVRIDIDGESITAELGDVRFAGEVSGTEFQLRSATGERARGQVAEPIVGLVGYADHTVEFMAFELLAEDGYGQSSQATTATSTQTGCFCNTTYHRVYCRRTDGTWYWNASYC